jgi:hypothetical protein
MDGTIQVEENAIQTETIEDVVVPSGFADTLQPILTKNCGSCHESEQSPFFAVADTAAAIKALTQTRKVDFAHPEESRIVLRLSEDKHQCWSDCTADASVMLSALNDWIAGDSSIVSDSGPKNATGRLQLSSARIEEREPDSPGTLIFEAESGIVTAPMAQSSLPEASGAAYIGTPEQNQAALAANAPNAGRATYQFEVSQAGTYFVFARLQSPTTNANAFSMRIDSAAFTVWNFAVTGNNWQWIRSTIGNNVAQSFNLTSGMHSLEIRQREDGANIDLIAITNNPMFTEGAPNQNLKAQVLDFDISSLVGRKATFSIDVAVFDEFSFKFRNPKIVVESGNIDIEGIHVLINGKEVPEAATYHRLKASIAAPGAVISSAAMIVPKQNPDNTDEISFRFDVIK